MIKHSIKCYSCDKHNKPFKYEDGVERNLPGQCQKLCTLIKVNINLMFSKINWLVKVI